MPRIWKVGFLGMGLPAHLRCAHRQLIRHIIRSEERVRRAGTNNQETEMTATPRAPERIVGVASQFMKPHWSLLAPAA